MLRLLLPQAFITAVLLLALGVTSYQVLQAHFATHDREVLNDGTLLVETILRAKDNVPEVLREELPRDLGAFQYTHFQLEVMTRGGESLYRSQGFPEVPRETWASLPTTPELKTAAVTTWTSHEERSYSLFKAQGHLGRTSAQPVVLHLAIDTTRTTRTLAGYRLSLALLGLGGFIAGLILNASVAHRGLRPLRYMTTLIQDIRVHHLHHRVTRPGWPVEVHVLATAFDSMLEEIEDGVNRLSGFCSDLAHELRTPLTNLRAEVEQCLESGFTAADHEELLHSVLEEVERISVIVDRLLLLARLESTAANLEPLDLSAEVRRLVEYYRLEAEDRGIAIYIAGHGRPIVPADRTLVEIALGNVLSNAVCYARTRVDVTLALQPGELIIEVADDGEGVEAHHLPRLGTRFYRVDPSRSSREGSPHRSRPSHGLGLAIVRTALHLHGGSMEITSEVGTGTRVSLHFPRPSPPWESTSSTPASSSHPR